MGQVLLYIKADFNYWKMKTYSLIDDVDFLSVLRQNFKHKGHPRFRFKIITNDPFFVVVSLIQLLPVREAHISNTI